MSGCSHFHAIHSTFHKFLSHGQCKLSNRPLPASLQAWGDVMAPGADESGEVRLVANPATLQRLPWHRQHAIALADLVWKPLPDKELRAADGELPAGAPLRTRLPLQRTMGPDNLARSSVHPCGTLRFKGFRANPVWDLPPGSVQGARRSCACMRRHITFMLPAALCWGCCACYALQCPETCLAAAHATLAPMSCVGGAACSYALLQRRLRL